MLIVDDHPAFRRSLAEWLESHLPAVRISEAESGEEALLLARRQEPDIVFLDFSMPGMNGLEVARRLLQAHPRSRLALISGFADERLRAEAREAGALACISKHSVGAELEGVLERLMAPLPAGDADPIVDSGEGR